MKKNSIYIMSMLLVFAFMTSCRPKKSLAYYQNIDNVGAFANSNFEPTIQPDDLLMIVVSAPDAEAAVPFNLESTYVPSAIGQASQAARQQQLYLVDKDGFIDFPVLGELQLGGKTKTEVHSFLKEKLKQYIKTPIVNIRIVNYKISVQGEVKNPGTYPINSERVTLLEALSLAGDLTIYGKRENIVVVREVNGKKSFSRVDITKADFINSSYYYLSQNDLIYVEPNQAKSNQASVFNQNIPIWISIASLVSSAIFSVLLINKN